MEAESGSDQAPEGDLRLHPPLRAEVRLPADGARDRQGGRPHSSSTVHAHLANLEKIGLLRRDPTKPRAIELLVDKAKQAIREPGLPLVGQVAAGEPILAEENIEEYVEVPDVIGGRGRRLRAPGPGRLDARRRHPRGRLRRRPAGEGCDDGEIVVALLEDEATVKRFYREKDQVRLQPANKAYKPIRTADVELLGKVVGVFQEGLTMSAVATAERAQAEVGAAAAGRRGSLRRRVRRSRIGSSAPGRSWSARAALACPVCGGSMLAGRLCAAAARVSELNRGSLALVPCASRASRGR